MKSRSVLAGLLIGILGFFSCARQSASTEKSFTSADLERVLADKPRTVHVFDVRTPEEYAAGHVPGAVNLPVDTIAGNPPAVSKGDRIVVYCRSGARSARAKTILQGEGYTDVVDFGTVSNWKGKLVTGDKPE